MITPTQLYMKCRRRNRIKPEFELTEKYLLAKVQLV